MGNWERAESARNLDVCRHWTYLGVKFGDLFLIQVWLLVKSALVAKLQGDAMISFNVGEFVNPYRN